MSPTIIILYFFLRSDILCSCDSFTTLPVWPIGNGSADLLTDTSDGKQGDSSTDSKESSTDQNASAKENAFFPPYLDFLLLVFG